MTQPDGTASRNNGQNVRKTENFKKYDLFSPLAVAIEKYLISRYHEMKPQGKRLRRFTACFCCKVQIGLGNEQFFPLILSFAQRDHKKCDGGRPCSRCVSLGSWYLLCRPKNVDNFSNLPSQRGVC